MKWLAKLFLILLITGAAVSVGYKFLLIRADLLLAKPEEEKSTEPVFSSQTLPEEGVVEARAVPEISEPAQNNEEKIVAHYVDALKLKGAGVIDSRYYADQAACDAAVRAVEAEYRRRGIRDQDITETSAFPDSKGAVVMFTNQDVLYYVGCIAPLDQSWAVYVQFKP